MGCGMIEIIYSKTYSMIYDVIGLGRLIHNDEDFLELLAINPIEYNNDIAYYKSLINMVNNPNNDVSSMFYLYKGNTVLKVIFEDLHEDDKLIKIESMQDFYNILSDTDYMFSIVNQIYFPELVLTQNNLPTKSELYTKFLVMPLSNDVEKSLYIFFEDPCNFCKSLISELKKYGKVIDKLYILNKSEIVDFKSTFIQDKIDIYNKHYNSNLREFKTIIIGIVYTNIYLIYFSKHLNDKIFLFLGKNSYTYIKKDISPKIDIIKYTQVISDEIRLKILYLLKTQDMYGNEIAKKLNLKRNIIMYHIEILVKENIINFHIKDNNIYYKINKNYFENIYQYIKDFV